MVSMKIELEAQDLIGQLGIPSSRFQQWVLDHLAGNENRFKDATDPLDKNEDSSGGSDD